MTKREFFEAMDPDYGCGVYDLKNGIFFFIDEGDGNIYGAQYKELSMEMITAIVELGCENIEMYLREHYPAPGTCAEDRLEFYDFDTLEDAWNWEFEAVANYLIEGNDLVDLVKYGTKNWR